MRPIRAALGGNMGMIFGDLNNALSVKCCYSKLVLSSAVFILTLLLSAAFFLQEMPQGKKDDIPSETTALLD